MIRIEIQGKGVVNMFKNIKICYFSGTGNTKMVAELFEAEFETAGVETEIIRIERLFENKIELDIENYDLIGIGYPVHALDAPQIIYDFIALLPPGDGKKTFIFKTAADWVTLNKDSSAGVIIKLKSKDYDVFYDNLVVMPLNVVARFKPEMEKQLYDTAVRKVKRHSREILSGLFNLKKAGILSKMLRWFGNLEKYGAAKFGSKLTTTKDCSLCDQCINNCPAGNIQRSDDRLKFGGKCLLCMRCMYECPQNAIIPKRVKFLVIKKGYNLPEIIHNPDIKGVYITGKTRGFFKHYYKYINSD
jgi:flavodoxin/NAD-dependent dihydropyrimidine dehydrogenase PreA subunit